MQLYRGTRRWIFWPCITITLIGCLFLFLTGEKRYTLTQARAIFHQLTQQHASEEEVIELLGSQSKLVFNPSSNQQERKYYFNSDSLFKAELLESWPVYDERKRVAYWVNAQQTLEGMKLWKYRWEMLLGGW